MTPVVTPVLVPLLAGVLGLLVPARARAALLVTGALAHLAAAVALFLAVDDAGALGLTLGGWPAGLGISFVADLFAASCVLLCAVLGLAVSLQAAATLDRAELHGGAAALIPLLLAGVNAAFLSADLFHVYVAFEVVLMASFVLLALSGGEARRTATLRYLVPSLLSSSLLLAGVGLLYGRLGTLDMVEAGRLAGALEPDVALTGAGALLAVAFLIKAAAFPWSAWLSSSYPEAPGVILALFAGLLTKVGVYALVRVFTQVLPAHATWLPGVLGVIAALTMAGGVLAAMAQWQLRRLLSFHVISQIGYLLLAVAVDTALGLTALVFYLVHNSVAKTALLLGTDLVHARTGHDDLRRLGGLARSAPLFAGLFLVSALSLAGLPPLSGFWAKLTVVRASLEAEQLALAGCALGVSLLTLYSMAKIWSHAFWGEPADDAAPAIRFRARELVAPGLLALVSILMGLGAGPALELAERAAQQLLDGADYARALGGP